MSGRGRRLFWLTVAFTLLASCAGLACAGGGSAVKTYTDSHYGFSFDYPGDWKLARSDEVEVTSGAQAAATLSVGDPKGARSGDTGLDLMMVSVYPLTQTVDEATLQEQIRPYLETLLSDFQAQEKSWEVQQPLTETTVGGSPAYWTAATFDWDANTPMKTSFYFVFAGDMEYQLVVQATADHWEADRTVFDAFVASFSP
jgi:hypothetical protein